jgi:hypothetical protein
MVAGLEPELVLAAVVAAALCASAASPLQNTSVISLFL